ncbi:MAG: GAF and ANTAR domain-containing protein [Mycobacteriaceae bacterium]
MAGDRLSRILAELSAEADGGWSSTRLCEVTRDIVGVSGAGVMLMSGDIPRGSLCATDEVSNLIEELQFTLGEGPCIDAFKQNRVVIESDLAHPVTPRWLAFTQQAVDAGARAVFAFPLRVGVVNLGVVDLYRDGPGPLTDEQHADALVMADVVSHWVLDVQANAPSGALAEELAKDADFHFVVHNAAGAVSVQLGVSITEALIRLRAYAFSNNRLLRDVAENVIRFDNSRSVVKANTHQDLLVLRLSGVVSG